MLPKDIVNICLNGFSICICIIAIVIAFVVRRMNKASFYFILGFTGANIVVLSSIIASTCVRGHTDELSLRVYPVTIFLEFLFSIVLALVFTFYLYEELQVRSKERFHIVIVYALAFLSLFIGVVSKLYYTIDENNIYHRQVLHPLSSVFGLSFMLYSVYLIIRYRKNVKKSEFVVLLIYVGLIMGGTIIQTFIYGLSFINISTTLAFVILSIEMVKRQVEMYNETIKETEKIKTQVVISQIQPHFLYNSLTAISAIAEDPRRTRNAIADFSKYLRGNLDTLSYDRPIEFKKEMEHVETYLKLEKLRFGDEINIVMDIYKTDFVLPALSIQILAENAIKHGITQKEEGEGTLIIRTEETPSGVIIISVIDDGVGFDVDVVPNDGRSHVGLANLRERLRIMCNADLYIESEIGKGTIARIVLPKEGNEM